MEPHPPLPPRPAASEIAIPGGAPTPSRPCLADLVEEVVFDDLGLLVEEPKARLLRFVPRVPPPTFADANQRAATPEWRAHCDRLFRRAEDPTERTR